jgi:hypothetical protein
MPNSHNISLKRLAIEGTVIVASILLAFAIDAWWDERLERAEEQEILLGLKSEFSRYREELTAGMEYQAARRRMTAILMAATRRGSWDSETVPVDLALGSLGDSKTHDFGGGVLDALISAGRLEIISDHELRAKLASWGQVFDEIHDDEMRNRRLVEARIMPYFLRWHIPQSRGLELCCSSWTQWPLPTRSINDEPGALARLLADPEFDILLEMKHIELAHADYEYKIGLQAMDDIINAIDRALSPGLR